MTRATAAVSVDTILRDRLIASVDRIVHMMGAAAKAEAASSPDVPSLVLSLVRGLPTTETDDATLKDSLVAAADFKRRMLRQSGGALTAAQVREVLGHKSLQAVYKAVKERRLLMVEDNGTQLFPAFQFKDGAALAAIPLVLEAAPSTDGWGILQYLVSGDQALGGARPLDLLKGGPDEVSRVVRFVRTLEDCPRPLLQSCPSSPSAAARCSTVSMGTGVQRAGTGARTPPGAGTTPMAILGSSTSAAHPKGRSPRLCCAARPTGMSYGAASSKSGRPGSERWSHCGLPSFMAKAWPGGRSPPPKSRRPTTLSRKAFPSRSTPSCPWTESSTGRASTTTPSASRSLTGRTTRSTWWAKASPSIRPGLTESFPAAATA